MKRNFVFFVISLFLHITFIFLLQNMSTSYFSPISISVEEKPPQKKASQIVEQQIFNHKTPENTPYYSKHNNTTPSEFKGKLGQSPVQMPPVYPIPAAKNEVSIDFLNNTRSVFYGNKDFLENVEKTGEQNLLNTKEVWFYSFHARVKRQIYWHWVRELKQQIQESLISSMPHQTLTTQIDAFLDPKGYLKSIIVRKKSGFEELDSASIQAIQKAHPFPNPPEPLISEDGAIHLNYTFALSNEAPVFPK